jgi:hypothetical protein
MSASTCYAEATGILEIYSNPEGAMIYIDGISVGPTPYQNTEIPLGKHKIKAYLSADYPAQVYEVNVGSTDPVTYTFNFVGGKSGKFSGIEDEQAVEKFKGNVVFASIPTGATIYINDEKRKDTPIAYKEVEVGRYNVKFEINGKVLKGPFDIIKNDTVKLVADFNKGKIINSWEEARIKEKEIELELKREKARIIEEKESEKREFEAKIEQLTGRITANNGRLFRGSNGFILDINTGLLWAIGNNMSEQMSWDDAKQYCANYTGGGFSEWRLPNKRELIELYQAGGKEKIHNIFRFDTKFYWGATSSKDKWGNSLSPCFLFTPSPQQKAKPGAHESYSWYKELGVIPVRKTSYQR